MTDNRDEILRIRISAEEKRAVRVAAALANCGMSAFVRELLRNHPDVRQQLGEAQGERKSRQ